MQEYLTRYAATACPQKEYLTRHAYPSIFIRRRLHSYISRNVTITNAPVHCQQRRLPVSGGATQILQARWSPFALRHWLYPIFQARPRKTKHRGIRFPHMRLACTRWIHFGRDIPLSARRYRASPSSKTFRLCADKPWIRNLQETWVIRLCARTYR